MKREALNPQKRSIEPLKREALNPQTRSMESLKREALLLRRSSSQ